MSVKSLAYDDPSVPVLAVRSPASRNVISPSTDAASTQHTRAACLTSPGWNSSLILESLAMTRSSLGVRWGWPSNFDGLRSRGPISPRLRSTTYKLLLDNDVSTQTEGHLHHAKLCH